MKKKSIMSYNDRQLISNIFIKSGDLSYGKIDVQDPRVDTITLLNVDGLKNKQDFVFELQKISCFSTDNFSLYFYTPNNISIFHYLYKENLKKYKLILKNHVLKNDVGNDYEEYNDSPIHKITINSKMVYEMIQYAELSIIMGYTTIEAFVNYSIPDDYIFQEKNNKGIIESYNRLAIERNLKLSVKIKKIISYIYEIEDISIQPFWSRFIELENIRNSIVHSKAEEKELFHKLFDVNTIKILESVNELLDYFWNAKKDNFPMFDCNGKLSFKNAIIDATKVKEMNVGLINDIDNDYSLEELLNKFKSDISVNK